ncbi:uncharacterized protein LOC127956044 isoform X3 [Carassius gibelio]|uniref:uncharacterized protein LOC127956044 isoform X3 n=1 Tax=Carassius gibelio TaxID=101364 RepID=UPI002277FDDC|nr:uncharacterized protein LOC127956044 isoform X3 [Carassius gibelio]
MSDNNHLCLLGLIFLSSLLTGISGVDDVHVFISSGEDVRLPCNNALQDCTSTTWNYNRFRHSTTVELIGLGRKKDTERHERLSLGSDCSLNIRNISTEDSGSYICQQWTGEGKEQQEPDARVYLHVLHVSSSHTEISAGLSVTLSCQLYSYHRGSCDDSDDSERIDLFWVNQAGVKLTRSDSRYQISSSSDPCIISLTTTLLNEDDNRDWRCNVTHRDQVKTSVTYTVKSSARADTTTEPSHTKVAVISVSVAAIAVLLAAVLWLIWRKRADSDRGTGEAVVKDENDDKKTYETINMDTPAAAREHERTDDVTYSEVSSTSKKPVKSLKDHTDTVTYATIR